MESLWRLNGRELENIWSEEKHNVSINIPGPKSSRTDLVEAQMQFGVDHSCVF